MNELNFSQSHKLLRPEAVKSVTQIGIGAVGSWAVRMYAKMGVRRVTIWDDDEVSDHNVPMSGYRPSDIARGKADALIEILAGDFGIALPRGSEEPYRDWIGRLVEALRTEYGFEIVAHRRRYAGEPLEGVVVMCVDSMESRHAVWAAVRDNPAVDLLVDTRTAAELLWVFAVCPLDPDDKEYYDHHVSYGSKEAEEHFCGQHGLMPVSLRAAGAVGSALTSWWMKGTKKLHHKELVVDLEPL